MRSGHIVLKRNYRKPWGEIDIVARALDGTLVFFEVKTLQRKDQQSLLPEDNLTAAKLKKLRRVCEEFTLKNPDLVNEKKGWRIDLIAIEASDAALAANDLTALEDSCEIRQYGNI